jgi:hypothetical protein
MEVTLPQILESDDRDMFLAAIYEKHKLVDAGSEAVWPLVFLLALFSSVLFLTLLFSLWTQKKENQLQHQYPHQLQYSKILVSIPCPDL